MIIFFDRQRSCLTGSYFLFQVVFIMRSLPRHFQRATAAAAAGARKE